MREAKRACPVHPPSPVFFATEGRERSIFLIVASGKGVRGEHKCNAILLVWFGGVVAHVWSYKLAFLSHNNNARLDATSVAADKLSCGWLTFTARADWNAVVRE